MSEMTTLARVKLALRIAGDDFDSEIQDLIKASMLDLGIAGVNGMNAVEDNPLVNRAIITYCKMNFGQPDDYDRLKLSYDEQKSQMSMASGWTTYGSVECDISR